MERRRVLVVDDDELTVEILRTILDLEEFDVVTCSDGGQALEIIVEVAPDVVVMDVMMPEVGGFEACERIKADPATAHIPVILLSARDSADDLLEGKAAGCDAYMTKPFSPLALIDAISEMRLARSNGRGAVESAVAAPTAAAPETAG